MTNSSRQDRVEELLRKSLLGEEVVNTQFHLFTTRSSTCRRVLKPRVLCANDVLLCNSSKYFLDLLSSDVDPSDPSLVDLVDEDDVPGEGELGEYGYASDSDLDEFEDTVPVANEEGRKDRSGSKDELSPSWSSDDGSKSIGPEHQEEILGNEDATRVGSVGSSETAIEESAGMKKRSGNPSAVRLRSLNSRHVLVKDTAFKTWYSLLNYLYMGKCNFLPLSSATASGQPRASLTTSGDEPRCSPKSMYRLACKVGLDPLRDAAFSYIRRNLTEHNILGELSCSLLSRHAELREMELDVLYAHVGSPSVIAELPALAKRIANGELGHGADIIIGIHSRMLQASMPVREPTTPPLPGVPQPVKASSSSSQAFPEESGPGGPSAGKAPGPSSGSTRIPFHASFGPSSVDPAAQAASFSTRPKLASKPASFLLVGR